MGNWSRGAGKESLKNRENRKKEENRKVQEEEGGRGIEMQ